MRIVFMGTPDFAVVSLQALLDAGHQIAAVYTQPDKPKNRGHKLMFSPVKELALSYEIPVCQPVTLRTEEAVSELASFAPDIIVVAAYGKILPLSVLELPPYGCINVHGSLLPKYRGAAPIQWAVINGEKTTGVTIQRMAEGVDTGDILLCEETEIGEEETSGDLFDRLKTIGARLLVNVLEGIAAGQLVPVPQDETEASKAPMLSREMSILDWSRPAGELHDMIRGLNPWPCACAWLSGKKLKIYASRVSEGWDSEPGDVRAVPGGLAVSCGRGALVLTDLQPENGKRMDAKSYLAGHPVKPGDRMEAAPV